MELKNLRDTLPYQWKVQAFWPPKAKEKKQCLCVAYIDARQAQDMLDDVVGPGNWQNYYYEEKGRLFCTVKINVDGTWVAKSDCGAESDMEAEKGEASDAFKRACVKWGIGRFLYDMPEMKIKAAEYKGKYYPADDKGNILWAKDKITEFCDSKLDRPVPPQPEEKEEDEKVNDEVDNFPKMTAEQKERMGRIWKFIKATYPDLDPNAIHPDDVAKAVFATLGKWPESAADEEKFCQSFTVEKV